MFVCLFVLVHRDSMHICGYACSMAQEWKSEETYRNQFFPFALWAPGIELRLLWLPASALTHWAISGPGHIILYETEHILLLKGLSVASQTSSISFPPWYRDLNRFSCTEYIKSESTPSSLCFFDTLGGRPRDQHSAGGFSCLLSYLEGLLWFLVYKTLICIQVDRYHYPFCNWKWLSVQRLNWMATIGRYTMQSKGTLGLEPALHVLSCSVTSHRVLSTSKDLQTKTK